jgi:1,4-dihydroxy-2-naphthoate octaprenyltransferase
MRASLQRKTFMLISHRNERGYFMQNSKIEKIKNWLALSRPPFHTVGILPFILGTILAYKINFTFSMEIFLLGVIAVMLIMLSTYHLGEYFDYREDEISQRLYKSNFAGGSGVIPAGTMPRSVALWTGVISFLLAGIIGITLQFVLKTGPYTLLLGCLGAFPGFFYSTKPVRLVQRGIGEIFIGFCYGWLPVASAYYIQTGVIHPVIHWIAIPIGLTIFNVIFLNEYPDYEADKSTGKKNLLYRIGKEKGKFLYIAFSLLASAAVLASPFWGIPYKVIYFYIPVLIISLFIVAMMLRGKYEDKKMLEKLCGLNIAVNLGTSLVYILVYI